MGFLGTGADWATDILILAEVAISLLVFLGVRQIRRDRKAVAKHRQYMLWVLVLNAVFLTGFLIQDALAATNVVTRATAPGWVFWPLLGVHLAIAVGAMTVAVWAWMLARRGTLHEGAALDLGPEARRAHRRVSRYYPWLWAATLATGLLLYAVLYVPDWT